MSTNPTVSVVMSVYNGERYLEEAIASILKQTLTDFEFIIINDGSSDTTAEILQAYEKRDTRIQVIHQDNQGLIVALNRGCSIAKGKYIARMDADDISQPERLEVQVDFMDRHPEFGITGSWVSLIDREGKERGRRSFPLSPGTITWTLLFTSCLAHPSVIMRREIIKSLDFYRSHALHAEDYDLWARACRVTRLANVPQILVCRRTWEESITFRKIPAQEANSVNIMRSQMSELMESDIPLSLVGAMLQVQRANYRSLKSLAEIKLLVELLGQLYVAYRKANSLTPRESKEIRRDVARKLAILAIGGGKLSVREGLAILAQALKLDPQILLRIFVARAIRR